MNGCAKISRQTTHILCVWLDLQKMQKATLKQETGEIRTEPLSSWSSWISHPFVYYFMLCSFPFFKDSLLLIFPLKGPLIPPTAFFHNFVSILHFTRKIFGVHLRQMLQFINIMCRYSVPRFVPTFFCCLSSLNCVLRISDGRELLQTPLMKVLSVQMKIQIPFSTLQNVLIIVQRGMCVCLKL